MSDAIIVGEHIWGRRAPWRHLLPPKREQLLPPPPGGPPPPPPPPPTSQQPEDALPQLPPWMCDDDVLDSCSGEFVSTRELVRRYERHGMPPAEARHHANLAPRRLDDHGLMEAFDQE